MEKTKAILGNLWVQVGAFCIVTVITVVLRLLLLPASGTHIPISPFFSLLDVRINVYGLLPPIVFASFLISIKWFFKLPTAGRLTFLIFTFVILTVIVNSADGGFREIDFRVLGVYHKDASKLYKYGNFLFDYHLKAEGLRGHTTVHPPGTFVYLYPLLKITGQNQLIIPLVNALVGSAGGLLTWMSAREIYGTKVANYAGLLYVTAPSLILYGSGFDVIYCCIGTVILFFTVLFFKKQYSLYAILIGFALAVGFFFSYQLVFYALLIVIWSIIYWLGKSKEWRRDGMLHERPTDTKTRNNDGGNPIKVIRFTANICLAGCVFVLFFLSLYVIFGFDVITVFHHQLRTTEKWFSAGWNVLYFFKTTFLGANPYSGEHRSYVEWVPGNLIAFGFLAGPPTTIMFVRNLWAGLKGKREVEAGFIFVSAVGASFILYDISGLTLGETERIWNFIIPLIVIGAGSYLAKNNRLLYPVLIINLVIAWAFEMFFWHVN